MQRRLPLLGCLVGLVLLTGLVVAAGGSQAAQGPVHTVADLRERLIAQPAAWVGRTVRVRGIVLFSGCLAWDAGGGAPCPDSSVYLLDQDGAHLLPVVVGKPDPLLAAWRRLPLAGKLVPAPQQIQWGALTTYRARLSAAPTTLYATPPCYAAQLLDIAPAARGEG
jgi:hypothetical protein